MSSRKCVALLIALCLSLGSIGCDKKDTQEFADTIEPLLPTLGYLADQLNVHGNLTGNVIYLFPITQP
jgi:hypothetical protein